MENIFRIFNVNLSNFLFFTVCKSIQRSNWRKLEILFEKNFRIILKGSAKLIYKPSPGEIRRKSLVTFKV